VGIVVRTKDVHHEADEAMVCRKWEQDFVDKKNMLEIVDDTFTVEEVHGDGKEVPAEGSGKREISLLARNLGNCNDFFKGYDLDGGDNHQDIDMTSEHSTEEAANHGQSPYRPCNESGLFLLIFRGLLNFVAPDNCSISLVILVSRRASGLRGSFAVVSGRALASMMFDSVAVAVAVAIGTVLEFDAPLFRHGCLRRVRTKRSPNV